MRVLAYLSIKSIVDSISGVHLLLLVESGGCSLGVEESKVLI